MTLDELVTAIADSIIERDGGERYIDCIFCDDGKTRLGINVETGVAHCFHCEWKSGDRESTYRSKKITYERLAEEAGITEPFTVEDTDKDVSVEKKEKELAKLKPKIEIKLPSAFEPLWKNIDDSVGKKALRYMRDRGVTDEQLKFFHIGFCAVGEYAMRIIFPVYYRRKLTGLVCRDFSGKSSYKYINSKGDKGLYNLPSKRRRNKTALLVEGVFDVLSAKRGVPSKVDVIGGLGSKLTDKQLGMLSTYNKIVVWAEPDRAGVEGTIKRAKQLLKKKVDVFVIMPLSDPDEDCDAGDMKPQEIRERFKQAVKYTSGIASLMRTRIAWSEPAKVRKVKSK